MESLKVKVNNEAESKEVQDFLKLNGYTRPYNNFNLHNGFVCINGDKEILCVCLSQAGAELNDYKEITIPQLKDLVILKRNDVNDATHENGSGQEMYEASNGDWYLYFNNKWKIDGVDIDDMPKPIEKEMTETEYLMQGKNGERLMESVGQLKASKEKHSHYRKSVKHLDFIDPYRIAQLYNLHSCADHIAKKALCTGKRGHKDLMRDIQDIIDTAERWKQMIQEDQNAI